MKKIKKHKRKKQIKSGLSIFPVLYPFVMGTPLSYNGGYDNKLGGQPVPSMPPPAAPSAPASESKMKPTRARVFHEMRKVLGLKEAFGSKKPGLNSTYVPSLMVYDFVRSPGLGFKSEAAWRVWEKALKIMDTEKKKSVYSKKSILIMAMSNAGIYRGWIDPEEYRLLEMGVDWYLSIDRT
jgi:hypothetical protein